MTRDEAIEKIKKLFALGKHASTDPAQAAMAIRHAQKFMQAHQIAEHDVDDDAINTHEIDVRLSMNIYTSCLLGVVGDAFGCRGIFSQKWVRKNFVGMTRQTVALFIGPKLQAEMAAYVFQVLLRQLERDKRAAISRVRKAANRASRGDEFGAGWVAGVRKMVGDFAGVDRSQDIAAYVAREFPNLEQKTTHARKGVSGLGDKQRGYNAGKEAQLHKPMGGSVPALKELGYG